MKELAPLFEELLALAQQECVDLGVNEAASRRVMFEDHEEFLGYFMCRVTAYVSPYDRRELVEAHATLFAAHSTEGSWDAEATFALWEDGCLLRTIDEAAEKCVAQLRASHASLFAAYDAHYEHQGLNAELPEVEKAATRQRL